MIAQEDSRLPITAVDTLHEQVDGTFKQQRLAARLVSFFGGLALLLACVGLYGVVAQGVARRTNEIGVRMALGAQRGNILWMVLRDTLALLLIGLAIGIPAAFGASHFISSQLYGLGATDAISFSLGVVILAVVMMLAGYLASAPRFACGPDCRAALRIAAGKVPRLYILQIAANLLQYTREHRGSESACLRVLLTRMIRTEQTWQAIRQGVGCSRGRSDRRRCGG